MLRTQLPLGGPFSTQAKTTVTILLHFSACLSHRIIAFRVQPVHHNHHSTPVHEWSVASQAGGQDSAKQRQRERGTRGPIARQDRELVPISKTGHKKDTSCCSLKLYKIGGSSRQTNCCRLPWIRQARQLLCLPCPLSNRVEIFQGKNNNSIHLPNATSVCTRGLQVNREPGPMVSREV